MAYRLSLAAGDLPRDLRRCGCEQLADALSRLREDADRETATHEARKDLKKARSLLRLARGCLPPAARSAENTRLRDIARSLAGTRDADVLVQTADGLGERHTGKLPATAFSALKGRFAADALSARAGSGAGVTDATIAALEAALDATSAWPTDLCDPDTLARGAGRAYRRGRSAFALARRDPTTENLHEWRKRVKDLWYHARLLEDAWPKMFKAQAKEAHRLSDLLGDDHDLAALATELDSGATAADAALDEATLRELIAHDRAELQTRAWRIGDRLYAEPPKAYQRRLARYAKAAHADVASSRPI